MHFCYYQNTKSSGKKSHICALIAFELMFVCVLFVVKENSKLWEISLRWYEFPLMPYCNPDKVLSLKKKYKQVWWQFLLWLYFIAWWMVKNTIHTLYRTYNIHCNYCCIFLSSARKIMSTCQKICRQHARWLSTCKIIMLIMLTSYKYI